MCGAGFDLSDPVAGGVFVCLCPFFSVMCVTFLNFFAVEVSSWALLDRGIYI